MAIKMFQILKRVQYYTSLVTMPLCFLLCQYMVVCMLKAWYNSLSSMLSTVWLILAVIHLSGPQARWYTWAGARLWNCLPKIGYDHCEGGRSPF